MSTRTLAADVATMAPGLQPSGGLWELFGGERGDARDHVVDTERVDWNDLMRRHGRRVVVSLLARGIAIDRAKDLAQDAWMRIIAQHEAGRLPMMRLPGLIIAQAMFLGRDELRRRRRRDQLAAPLVDAARDEHAVPLPSLERRVAARQDLRRVLEVVAKSYPSARQVFALTFGPRALGPAEIAAELGLSCQRVRQITCELRKRLRDAIGGDDVG